MQRPILKALREIGDDTLLRHTGRTDGDTTVRQLFRGTEVDLAAAVMIGAGNHLTRASEVDRGRTRDGNLARFHRCLRETRAARATERAEQIDQARAAEQALLASAARVADLARAARQADAARQAQAAEQGRLAEQKDQGVDAAQHGRAEEAVVIVEVAGQRLAQLRKLDPHPTVSQIGEHPGVTLPGDHRVQHLAAGYAVQVADHRVEFDLRVFQTFSNRSFSGSDPGPGRAGSG
jgi:hypothetical protein